ncbi:hypothetical protein J3458_021868 [Metarhizium acridum]|uniref:uncharacterized protein n=1 Tax=Metarhizium acridum TaxID=92637 RepID=UPI001C6AC2C9|nr:hypothetical protein J3458_021868 [Metarhizium acridum]
MKEDGPTAKTNDKWHVAHRGVALAVSRNEPRLKKPHVYGVPRLLGALGTIGTTSVQEDSPYKWHGKYNRWCARRAKGFSSFPMSADIKIELCDNLSSPGRLCMSKRWWQNIHEPRR